MQPVELPGIPFPLLVPYLKLSSDFLFSPLPRIVPFNPANHPFTRRVLWFHLASLPIEHLARPDGLDCFGNGLNCRGGAARRATDRGGHIRRVCSPCWVFGCV